MEYNKISLFKNDLYKKGYNVCPCGVDGMYEYFTVEA